LSGQYRGLTLDGPMQAGDFQISQLELSLQRRNEFTLSDVLALMPGNGHALTYRLGMPWHCDDPAKALGRCLFPALDFAAAQPSPDGIDGHPVGGCNLVGAPA
jgi:hypothetical protein